MEKTNSKLVLFENLGQEAVSKNQPYLHANNITINIKIIKCERVYCISSEWDSVATCYEYSNLLLIFCIIAVWFYSLLKSK
jgi:hypothetical protein